MPFQNVATILSTLIGEMTETAFADKVNVPKATINRLLSGRTPDPRVSTLIPIANYFGITINQLLGLEPLPTHSPIQCAPENGSILKIPYIELDKLTGWITQTFQPNQFYSIIASNDGMIDQHAYLTKVDSDGMSPKFNKDTFLIVNKKVAPQPGDYGVFYIEEENQVCFRKLITEGPQHYLYALHPGYEILGPFKKVDHLGTVIEGRFSLK